MAKTQMRDVVILVPGITGSVLQKHGRDVWALSGQALWGLLRARGELAKDLMLVGDDPEREDLGDGIRATAVMPDFHWLPGLEKIDGYNGLRKLIAHYFDVYEGRVEDPSPGNYFEFPYDWRRDNRFTARRLRRLLEERVEQWRATTRFKDAKAILIAHSMGGLVGRYALEVLEGWPWCRALITLGTPFRGSPQALESLSLGCQKIFVDLTEAVRSFSSVYQLLPIYKMLKVEGTYRRVAETEGIPGLERPRAEAALLEFHRKIESAVPPNRDAWRRGKDGYVTIPIAGMDQPTLQSAALVGGEVRLDRTLPEWIDPLLDNGDGTVPCASAVPIEMSNKPDWRRVSERHEALQNNARAQADLRDLLDQIQVRGWEAVRKLEEPLSLGTEPPALSVDLEDLYELGKPVRIGARLVRRRENAGVVARIEALGEPGPAPQAEFRQSGDDCWEVRVDGLAEGLYRVEVATRPSGPLAPPAVHGVFAVA